KQALDDLGEGLAIGQADREVMQSGVAARRLAAAFAVPRVQRDVMVIVARGQERGSVEPRNDLEPEQVAVERDRRAEVGDAQMDVADPGFRVDCGGGVHAGHCAPRAHRFAPWEPPCYSASASASWSRDWSCSFRKTLVRCPSTVRAVT